MTYLALRIIATLLIIIGTYFFLEAVDLTRVSLEDLPEDAQADAKKSVPLIRCIMLIARAFELFVIWII